MNTEDLVVLIAGYMGVCWVTLVALLESEDHKELGVRGSFWFTVFAPLVIMFFAGFWLARLLAYLFFLRKTI